MFQVMDLFLGLLCLAVAIVFAVVIYFISVSSMKEKTYDEVKAEQKKKAEEYLSQGRTVKDKAKDKKLKKAGKKVKEKTTVIEHSEMSSEEADTGKGHVAFVEPPVIVDKSLVVSLYFYLHTLLLLILYVHIYIIFMFIYFLFYSL